jgi:hypothetical protein
MAEVGLRIGYFRDSLGLLSLLHAHISLGHGCGLELGW